MMARTTTIIIKTLVEIERHTSALEFRVLCFSLFLFVNNAPQINVAGDLVGLIQQEIASVFVGRFRCGLKHFFPGRKAFPAYRRDLKTVARWRYDWCLNGPEIFQNLRKWVHRLCTPLRPFRSEMKDISTTAFYPMYCRSAFI